MTDHAIRAPLAEDGEGRTYTVKAWRVKLGDLVEEGDPVCDLSFEGGIVTVTSPTAGRIQNINRIEGQQVDAAYTIGFVVSTPNKRAIDFNDSSSLQEGPPTIFQALKNGLNRGWREQLAMALALGVTIGVAKGLYNYFTEPSFEEWLVEEMEAELDQRERSSARAEISVRNATRDLLLSAVRAQLPSNTVSDGDLIDCVSYNELEVLSLFGAMLGDRSVDSRGIMRMLYQINWGVVDFDSLRFGVGATGTPYWHMNCFENCFNVGRYTGSSGIGSNNYSIDRALVQNYLKFDFERSLNESIISRHLQVIDDYCANGQRGAIQNRIREIRPPQQVLPIEDWINSL